MRYTIQFKDHKSEENHLVQHASSEENALIQLIGRKNKLKTWKYRKSNQFDGWSFWDIFTLTQKGEMTKARVCVSSINNNPSNPAGNI